MGEILLTFLKLGLISFGGPIAHIGYFHTEFVLKKKWVEENVFAELVALTQLLPGPASSQLGICIGILRGGYLGGVLAWIGFTLPSAVLLVTFAAFLKTNFSPDLGWIHGLKLTASAVVAYAVVSMWNSIAIDKKTKTIAIFSATVLVLRQNIYSQFLVMLLGACLGVFFLVAKKSENDSHFSIPIRNDSGKFFLIGFVLLAGLLPALRILEGNRFWEIADSFYRSGAFVFGGGHVVLPLLEKEIVLSGWLDRETFLAGYGAAQAVPGPLFTFAAYLGYFLDGIFGAGLSLFWIFLPSFLIVFGVLPYWEKIRSYDKIQSAIQGMNSSVLGILIAALYDPVFVSSVHSGFDFAAVLGLFSLMLFFRLPSWAIVILGVFIGFWNQV